MRPELEYYVRGETTAPKIALTFDDGPNPPRTDQILDILDRAGAHATFFVIGKWVERWPKTVERILDGGNAVGNHSYLHAWHICDYDLAEAVIAHLIGRPTRYLRAQSFDYDALAQTSLTQDHLVIDANVNPADWMATDPDAIVDAVLQDPQLGPGSIIDLHDGWEIDDHAQRIRRPVPTVKALPRLIGELQARSFELVTLDDMSFHDPLIWTGERDERDVVKVRKGQLMSDARSVVADAAVTP